MEVVHNCIVDQFPPAAEGEPHLAAWYSQGHSDAFGDRLLMFDNTSAPSWELLRFRPALAHDGRFAAAVHDRVEQLRSLNHPDFPVVRNLKKWRDEDGLAVVSTYVSGVRLSDALNKPRSTAFAARLIQHLVPAFVALQRHRPGIAHGA